MLHEQTKVRVSGSDLRLWAEGLAQGEALARREAQAGHICEVRRKAMDYRAQVVANYNTIWPSRSACSNMSKKCHLWYTRSHLGLVDS